MSSCPSASRAAHLHQTFPFPVFPHPNLILSKYACQSHTYCFGPPYPITYTTPFQPCVSRPDSGSFGRSASPAPSKTSPISVRPPPSTSKSPSQTQTFLPSFLPFLNPQSPISAAPAIPALPAPSSLSNVQTIRALHVHTRLKLTLLTTALGIMLLTQMPAECSVHDLWCAAACFSTALCFLTSTSSGIAATLVYQAAVTSGAGLEVNVAQACRRGIDPDM